MNMLLCAGARVPQLPLKGPGLCPFHEHVILCCVGSWLNRDSDIKPALQPPGLPIFTLGVGRGIST